MSTWFDAKGGRIERLVSPGAVVLRVDADHLSTALGTTLEITVEAEPPQVVLLTELDRSEAYALSAWVTHPGLTEDALLQADPNRPVTLRWTASDQLARAVVAALRTGPPEQVLTAPGDRGYPAVLDLENYELAAVHRPL